MSQLGQKYDTSQPELVLKFVNEVRTQERLDMLFLVTCADLAAVGPDVLNSWKVEVLGELYKRAYRRLSHDVAPDADPTRNGERQAVWDVFDPAEKSDPWFERQLNALPESLVAQRTPASLAELLRRLRNLEPRAGMAWANYLPETGMTEFIAGVDQGAGRAIVSSMAGALTSNRMQIMAAETNMLADGLMVLRYVAHVPEEPGQPSPHRLEQINNALVASIDSNEVPSFPKIRGREQKEAGAVLSNLPNEVRIDNELWEPGSVVEVFTVDRRGLLYRLARALHDLGLMIRFAKIGTRVDQVVDVFYVTERDGQKPTADERLDEIRSKLMDVIRQQ
jgi:[protein-PII] uridylyltransferase